MLGMISKSDSQSQNETKGCIIVLSLCKNCQFLLSTSAIEKLQHFET